MPAQQFPGLYSDFDSYDIAEGASVVQDNCQSFIAGKLSVRKGLGRESSLIDSVGTFLDDDLIAIYKYVNANRDVVITADRNGNLKTRLEGIVNTIATGRFNDGLWSFIRDRRGSLIGVNGRERGIHWDGESSTVDKLGVDGPATAPTVSATSSPAGNLTSGQYQCYYRYVANPINSPAYSVLSPVKTVTAATNDSLIWSSLDNPTQDRVVRIEMWRTLSGGSNVLYLVGTIGTEESVVSNGFASNGGNLQITFSNRHYFEANQWVTISGSTADDGNFKILSVESNTVITVDKSSFSASGSSAKCKPYGLSADGASDQSLIDAAINDASKRLLILDAAGNLVANRFVPPPDYKHSVATLQDRTFYAGDVEDAVDEITTTANSTTVTFSTADSIPENIVGNVIWIPLSTGPKKFEVESIDSSTEISVYPEVPESVTTVHHSIRPAETERNKIYYSEVDEPESVPLTNVLTVQEQSDDEDEIVGLHSFGSYLYILKERHIYSLSFARQPRIDAQARLITHRGAFNKNCWKVYEGTAYVMDQSGAYVLSLDGSFSPLSVPVQNLFRNGTVDFKKSKWFFVSVDYNTSIVRFHVSFAQDSGDRPRRAICFSIRNESWWTESYPFALSNCAMAKIEKFPKLLFAGQAGLVVSIEKQESEIVENEIRGTVTSATTTQITDSNASFTDEVIGAPIAITGGDGRCQIRTILSRVNETTVTIGIPTGYDQVQTQDDQDLFFQDGTAWEVQLGDAEEAGDQDSIFDPVPEAGDSYLIGAILWEYRSKRYGLANQESRKTHHIDIDYSPTNKAYEFDLSLFFDEASKADDNSLSHNQGVGVIARRTKNYHTVKMQKSLNARGARKGDNRISFNSRTDMRMQSHRSMAYEIKGIKGEEAIELDQVQISIDNG